jgi:hypothetical protein
LKVQLERLVPSVSSPHAGSNRTCAADQRQHNRRIFGRVGAPGLGAQGKSSGKDQSEGEGKSCLFHVDDVLDFVFSVFTALFPDCSSRSPSVSPAARHKWA